MKLPGQQVRTVRLRAACFANTDDAIKPPARPASQDAPDAAAQPARATSATRVAGAPLAPRANAFATSVDVSASLQWPPPLRAQNYADLGYAVQLSTLLTPVLAAKHHGRSPAENGGRDRGLPSGMRNSTILGIAEATRDSVHGHRPLAAPSRTPRRSSLEGVKAIDYHRLTCQPKTSHSPGVPALSAN
jgi:hypothetical protein